MPPSCHTQFTCSQRGGVAERVRGKSKERGGGGDEEAEQKAGPWEASDFEAPPPAFPRGESFPAVGRALEAVRVLARGSSPTVLPIHLILGAMGMECFYVTLSV